MRRSVGTVFAILTLLALGGCSDEVKSSGVQPVDQSAVFVKYVIDSLREEGRFENASQIATYLTSAQGLLEFMPPNPETDPEGAAAYDGPRPHKDVALWPRRFRSRSFAYYLLISGDDETGKIHVGAYNANETQGFYLWTF